MLQIGFNMIKSWVIWSLVFILVGAAGLGWVFIDRYIQQKSAASQAEFITPADEYIGLYEQWCQLEPEEKKNHPWGYGKYGGAETREQLKQQQMARLQADLADLANGIKEPLFLADLFYGLNWQNEVGKYRSKNEFFDGIILISSISILAGGIIVAGYFLRWLVRIIAGILKRIGERISEFLTNCFHRIIKKQPTVPRKQKPKTNEHTPEILAAQTEPDKSPHPQENRTDSQPVPDEESDCSRTYRSQQSLMNTLGLKDSLVGDVEEVVEEIDQLREAAENTQLPGLMTPKPVDNSLSELTQEVSAIREFAAQQQDRVRKLQDGYDWSIIKRFCLRIIRCIDNLDDRIARLSQKHKETQYLAEVRDELVFALESSGVEQFEPQTDSDYKGQEKCAEAVKQRVKVDDIELFGKIAEVVRPGYQYVVSDSEVKIVRSAQVSLYS